MPRRNRRQRLRRARRAHTFGGILLAAFAALTVAALAACGDASAPSQSDTPDPSDAGPTAAAPAPPSDAADDADLSLCEAQFKTAAELIAMGVASTEDLDAATSWCGSVADWEAAAAKFPAALRGKGPMDDLRERCTRMPAHVDLCRQVQ